MQRFSPRSEESESPIGLPSPGLLLWEYELPKCLALKASRACSQEPPELRAKEISLQEGAHRVQHVTKAATPYKMGQIYLLVFKGPLGRGEQLWLSGVI